MRLPTLSAENEDTTIDVETQAVPFVTILLILVILIPNLGRPSPQAGSPPTAEFVAAEEGTPRKDELVLLYDGRRLWTGQGRSVGLEAIPSLLRPAHRSIGVLVPETLTVPEALSLRKRLMSSAAPLPIRIGPLTKKWKAFFAEETAR